MTVLETKHTASTFNKTKKDLLNAIKVIACISMLCFVTYYLYLISLNLEEPFYLAIYSSLICSIIFFFLIEFFIREDEKLLKNQKRILVEKKRKWKSIVKVLKYTAKTLLVSVAIYETSTHFDLSIPNIFNMLTSLLLLLQILFEVVVRYAVKQMDRFRLAIELDINKSPALSRLIISKLNTTAALQNSAITALGEEQHTPYEEKLISSIQDEAEEYQTEKEKKQAALRKIIKTSKIKPKKK